MPCKRWNSSAVYRSIHPLSAKSHKNEHRVFAYSTKSCAARPFLDTETAINLIGSTTTRTGLVVKCNYDTNVHQRGVKVSDEDFDNIALTKLGPMPQWNYVITGFQEASKASNV